MLRVIGIGDNVLDRYLHLNLMFPGGNAVNVPVFMARGGADAAYLGKLGTDRSGRHLKAVLEMEGIDLQRARVVDGENAYAVVNLIDGERVFVSGAGTTGVSGNIMLGPDDLDYIANYDLIHTSIYSGLDDSLPRLRATGVPISYDFSEIEEAGDHTAAYPYVTYAFFSAGDMPADSLCSFLKAVVAQGPSYAMATRGPAGALLLHGGKFYEQPVVPVQVVDTMGAGDSFIATFLLHRLQGETIPKAMAAAAAAAAATCTWQGTFGHGIPIQAF